MVILQLIRAKGLTLSGEGLYLLDKKPMPFIWLSVIHDNYADRMTLC